MSDLVGKRTRSLSDVGSLNKKEGDCGQLGGTKVEETLEVGSLNKIE